MSHSAKGYYDAPLQCLVGLSLYYSGSGVESQVAQSGILCFYVKGMQYQSLRSRIGISYFYSSDTSKWTAIRQDTILSTLDPIWISILFHSMIEPGSSHRQSLTNLITCGRIVDIFFAILVASLPTLNGLVDNAISTFTTWYSTHKSSTFSKLLASRSTSRGCRTKIENLDSKTELQVDINKPKTVLHNASKSSTSQYETSTWKQANDVELQTQARN